MNSQDQAPHGDVIYFVCLLHLVGSCIRMGLLNVSWTDTRTVAGDAYLQYCTGTVVLQFFFSTETILYGKRRGDWQAKSCSLKIDINQEEINELLSTTNQNNDSHNS